MIVQKKRTISLHTMYTMQKRPTIWYKRQKNDVSFSDIYTTEQIVLNRLPVKHLRVR